MDPGEGRRCEGLGPNILLTLSLKPPSQRPEGSLSGAKDTIRSKVNGRRS